MYTVTVHAVPEHSSKVDIYVTGPYASFAGCSQSYLELVENIDSIDFVGFGAIIDHDTLQRSHLVDYNGDVWDISEWPNIQSLYEAKTRAFNALGNLKYKAPRSD